jgi:ketosteroid isomerase-like protein
LTIESLISEAKAVMANHESLFESGDLDAVMKNFADDIVVIANDSPIVEGKPSLKTFYSGLLDLGRWSFVHKYSGAAVTESCVFLHGVAHGSHSPGNGDEPFSFANNFLIVMRKVDGRPLIWRAAFMPGASD